MTLPTDGPTSEKSLNPTPGKLGWVAKTALLLLVAASVLFTAGAVVVYGFFSSGLPDLARIQDYRPAVSSRVLGSGGRSDEVLGEFAAVERRTVVPTEQVPKHVVHAFTAAEDAKFFEHQGVNPLAILRAALANMRAGAVKQGGSTITQQVAKSFLSSEKSLSRKVKELFLSVRLERELKKEEILFLYLNQIYLGSGAYGVQAAAQAYFGKDVGQLTIAEGAILAGLPQAPSMYDPHRHPAAAKKRQLYVLNQMRENGFITQAEMTDAATQPLKLQLEKDPKKQPGSYLVEQVRRHLAEKYGDKAVYEQGLTVATPMRKTHAVAAHRAIHDGLHAIDQRIGYRGPLRTLAGEAEIEAFLKDERKRLIRESLGYTLLLADGRHDDEEAFKRSGLGSEVRLLQEGQTYSAAVTSVDDKRKVAGIFVGAVYGEIPLEKMRWARPVRDKDSRARGEPTAVSKVLAKGDVIRVRLVAPGTAPKANVFALDQDPQVQAALVSIDVKTGALLAMEGGLDFSASEFNRAMQAQRQPGSAFKPLIYASGLERGFTPASVILDAPIVYEDSTTGKWKPNNFEEKFYGDTSFRQSLIKSRNVPTIKIVQAVQVPYLIDYAKRLGLDAKFAADLSISLGSATVSLFDLTKVYALFPRLGRRVDPIWVQSVRDRDGKVLEERKASPPPGVSEIEKIIALPGEGPNPPKGTLNGAIPGLVTGLQAIDLPKLPNDSFPDQLMDPRVAYVMTHLMKEVVNYGTGYEAKELGRPAAGKTGTTNDSIDAWFMGFTPQVVTGVWVGFDGQRPIGASETGARAALPIWLSFMKAVMKDYSDEDFVVPPGVTFASIDAQSGRPAPASAASAIREAFITGTVPGEGSVLATAPGGSAVAASGDEGAAESALSRGRPRENGGEKQPSKPEGAAPPVSGSDHIREDID